jgi:hypothetical protein
MRWRRHSVGFGRVHSGDPTERDSRKPKDVYCGWKSNRLFSRFELQENRLLRLRRLLLLLIVGF